jgi:hypothetical protein
MILRDRMTHHYMMDKQHLAGNFSAWLSERMRYYLSEGMDVTLFMDAGSAVLWLSLHLWPLLAKISQIAEWGSGGPRRVRIITNNLPLAEGYADQCESKQFSSESPTPIICELLGGIVQSRYAAMTGGPAQERLKDLIPAIESQGSARHICILAGNYIRLFGAYGKPPYPTPLIRGAGQQELKQLYVDCAHETYIMGSIGKLFRSSTDNINLALRPPDSSITDMYKDVAILPEKRDSVKLVTTYRGDRRAILKVHSERVLGLLGDPGDPMEVSASLDISFISHFCYCYDDPIAGKSSDEQLKIEFPHPETRREEFLTHYGLPDGVRP